jgi:hypothetical protein
MSYFDRKNPLKIFPIELLTIRPFLNYELFSVSLKVPYHIFNPSETPDVLEVLSPTEIEKLRYNPNAFFIFDYTGEGTSYKEYLNFFNTLEYSASKHNIPFHKMFFLSSNLLDEDCYKEKKINVISFNRWDYFPNARDISLEETLSNFEDKVHFLNLNRVIRYFRVLTILKLVNSKLRPNLKISYDNLSLELLSDISDTHYNQTGYSISKSELASLSQSSPSILDRSDFDVNWVNDMPVDLFKSTIMSLVGETLERSHQGTTLFYSEKTFKPMLFNHPILIFGQPNTNKFLSTLGYKTYDCYFDLDFDNVEDFRSRLESQITNLEVLNDSLCSMNSKQKLDWFMQGKDIILHNKLVMKQQDFNKRKSLRFLELIKQYSL